MHHELTWRPHTGSPEYKNRVKGGIMFDPDVTHNNGSEDRDWAGECAPVDGLCDEAQWDLSGPEHGEEGGPGEERHRGDGGPHCYEGDGGADQEHGPGD